MSKLEELALLLGLTLMGLMGQIGTSDPVKAEEIARDILSSCHDVQEMRERIENIR